MSSICCLGPHSVLRSMLMARPGKIAGILQEIEGAVHAKDWEWTRDAALTLKYRQAIDKAARKVIGN